MATDYTLLAGILLIITLLMDWRQTLDIKNHQGFKELNPILGDHPSDLKIHIYFSAWIFIVAVACMFVDGDNPRAALLVICMIRTAQELFVISKNKKLGLRIL